jgi:hypothetical protein
MSIITESKTTRRLTILLVMIMGVAMIIPSNLAFASPDDGSDEGSESGDGTDEGSESGGGGSSDEVTTEDDQTEPEESDPCEVNPNAPGCGTEPVDPCEVNSDLPECDPCVKNPDLDECKPHCIPEDPDCIPKCPPEFHFYRGLCIENSDDDDNNGGSSSKTTIILPSATTVEVSSCRLDGNAHGMQQKFDIDKYRACGLYPNGQIAYTDGFVVGCTQVGNTQQLCQAFVVMNTQQTQTAATQPITQSATQPTQTQLLTTSTQAIQPAAVS